MGRDMDMGVIETRAMTQTRGVTWLGRDTDEALSDAHLAPILNASFEILVLKARTR